MWIAATASVLDIPLITTDKDFIHLHNNYLQVEYIDIKTLDTKTGEFTGFV